jgi:putative phage-type endonuclease
MKNEANPEIRNQGVGGSDQYKIKSAPFELWQQKIGAVPSKDISHISAVKWGVILEEVILRELSKVIGKKIRMMSRTIRSKEDPIFQAHLDGKVVGEPIGVEIKTTSLWMEDKWGEEGTDQIPLPYYYQVQHYLYCTKHLGFKKFIVAVLIGGQKLKIYEVKPDKKFQREMVTEARIFWYNHVLTKVAPPARSIADCLLQFPQGEEAKQMLTDPFISNLIGSGSTIKKKIKELKGDYDELSKELMSLMKDSSSIIDDKGDKLVTWANSSRTSLDQKQLALSHPNLYEKFKQVSTFRTFKIKGQ